MKQKYLEPTILIEMMGESNLMNDPITASGQNFFVDWFDETPGSNG